MKHVLTDAELKYELSKFGINVELFTRANRPLYEERLKKLQERNVSKPNRTWSSYDGSRYDNNFDSKFSSIRNGVGDFRYAEKSLWQKFIDRVPSRRIISSILFGVLFFVAICYTISLHWSLFKTVMAIVWDAVVDTFDFVCRYLMLPSLITVLGYFAWNKFFSQSNSSQKYRGNNIISTGLGRFEPPKKSSWTYEDYRYPDKRWWQLTDQTSRFILAALFGFLFFLAVCYLGVVHRDKVVVATLIVYGACADTVDFVYKNMIVPLFFLVFFIGIAYGVYWYYKNQLHKQAEEQRQIYEMVEKIMATVKKHHEDCLSKGNAQTYLAVPHVRDMLVPPNRRKELIPIWEKAVKYLNETESRVRTETQCISGEEFMVWRWLQDIAGASKTDEKIWQGHAFPEEDIPYNMPKYAYFECLKVRGLFDSDLENEAGWPEHIQDAILEKLGRGVRVVHMAVDMNSKDGCVYMKLATKDEAGQAYKILHGSWFNGRLVSVKYLRPERYHERFHDAEKASIPLSIKKPRHSTAFLR